MIMLVLQVLLIVSAVSDERRWRSLPPNFAHFGGEFPGISDGHKRRELISLGIIGDAANYFTSGEVLEDAEEGAAWVASTGEDALHTTHNIVKAGLDEVEEVATDFKDSVEKAAIAGIREFEKIDFDEVMKQIDAVLKQMCFDMKSPDSCLIDIDARGCMPGDNECVITYGHGCLGLDFVWEGSVQGEFDYSKTNRGMELQAGLEVYGGATAAISSQAVVELHIESNPKIRVLIDPPQVNLDARVEISAQLSLTAEAQETRIELGQRHEILRKVFMAGYIPVVVAVHAQPVAYITASGELFGTGNIVYSASGTIGFFDELWLDLDLATFKSVHNFDTITAPTVNFEEGWEMNLEANVDLQLTAKVGVELSFSLYDVVEVNMLPMVVARVSANGQISASMSGNLNGVSDLSAEASGLAELCLSGDFKGYLDWVDHSGNRRSGRGRRQLTVDGVVGLEHRRELESINFKEKIVSNCEMATEALAPGCAPAQEVLGAFCKLAMEGLELLGFPTEINIPSLSDLQLPGLDLPQTCWTMSLDWSGQMDFNQAQNSGIHCGGHFHGSTVGLQDIFGNPSGDAWHTFVAGDSHMIIDACQSKYDSYIRLYRFEVYWERTCVGEVCFDMPKSRWYEVTSNDDHNGRCHSPGHGYASFLEVSNLIKGETYALVVEGYRSNEGQYSVSLSCPTLEASLQPQTISSSTCVDISLHTQSWGNEVSWSITGSATCFGNNYDSYGNYDVSDCCLEAGQSFDLYCHDSWGDGWHQGYIMINNKKYCDDFGWGPVQHMPNMIV